MSNERLRPVAARQPKPAPAVSISPRLQELFAKTVTPEAYPLTDDIVIQPPTKASRRRMDELQSQRMVGNFFLAEALKRSGDEAPTDADLQELTNVVNEAEDAYNREFFGAHHDAVLALFESRPVQHWQAFCSDIKKQFFANPGPETGACPHCGTVVDEEQAGKG